MRALLNLAQVDGVLVHSPDYATAAWTFPCRSRRVRFQKTHYRERSMRCCLWPRCVRRLCKIARGGMRLFHRRAVAIESSSGDRPLLAPPTARTLRHCQSREPFVKPWAPKHRRPSRHRKTPAFLSPHAPEGLDPGMSCWHSRGRSRVRTGSDAALQVFRRHARLHGADTMAKMLEICWLFARRRAVFFPGRLRPPKPDRSSRPYPAVAPGSNRQ